MPTFVSKQQPSVVSGMRRNESAAGQLQEQAVERLPGLRMSGDPADVRRNRSSTALSELRKREQGSGAGTSANANRQVVIDAVVLQLHQLMLAASAQAEAAAAAAAAAAAVAAAAPAANSSASATAASPPEVVGTAVRGAMHTYIDTIVRQLELPNSCIVAMLIYVQRAVADTRFTLTERNWQPCLLAAFVVAAKLSFDEPVWNEVMMSPPLPLRHPRPSQHPSTYPYLPWLSPRPASPRLTSPRLRTSSRRSASQTCRRRRSRGGRPTSCS